jgi:hypothetical protein
MIVNIDKQNGRIGVNGAFVNDDLADVANDIVSIKFDTLTQVGEVLKTNQLLEYIGANDFLPYQKYINIFNEKNATVPVFNLQAAIIAKLQYLAIAREQANLSNFTYLGKQYSATQTAQNDLNGIANFVSLNNSLPVSFNGFWLSISGDVLPLPNVAAFNTFYTAFVDQGNANFVKMTNLIAQAQAATTKQELDAIVW